MEIFWLRVLLAVGLIGMSFLAPSVTGMKCVLWLISGMLIGRASFYLDYMPRAGTYTLNYLVRCTLTGEALAPPAKVEPMYDPENFALSASREFPALVVD